MTRTLTQAELINEATLAFGANPMEWAFRCPTCGDVATAEDLRGAGGSPARIGQECIGRYLGALKPSDVDRVRPARGCDYVAYGLIPGPWVVEMPDGQKIRSFPLATGSTQDGA
jgi:hypothetical protein